jgi:hypothetical protein
MYFNQIGIFGGFINCGAPVDLRWIPRSIPEKGKARQAPT